MMSWLDSLPDSEMTLPHGTTVYRLRPKQVWNEYREEWVLGDWSDPEVLPIEGAFVASTSTSLLATATRDQASQSKSLFCEGSFDIQKGDRIRDGAPGAPVYTIDGIPPAADRNPFTGWQPPREIPLNRYVG